MGWGFLVSWLGFHKAKGVRREEKKGEYEISRWKHNVQACKKEIEGGIFINVQSKQK